MNFLVPVALFGWVFVSVALFGLMRRASAAAAAVVVGSLFLPISGYGFAGLPDYTKQTAVSLGLLLGAGAFHAGRFAALKPRWFDVPMVLLVLSPIATSLSNGLGIYDGMSSAFVHAMRWGVPYWVGRACFSGADDLRVLAVAIVAGGLVYVPLCLLEIRLSPQLHAWVYGMHQHSFMQSRRFGGFRPTVFMEHGLMVSLWMAGATVVAAWLWVGGVVRRIWFLPVSVATWVLGLTMVACKSVGATVLMTAGLAGVVLAKWRWRSPVLLVLVAFPVIYVVFRVADIWDFTAPADLASEALGEVTGGSLRFRVRNEEILIDHSLKRPLLGWGGWMRNRPEELGMEVVTDGLWIISFSQRGLIGLAAFLATVLLPPAIALRMPSRGWTGRGLAAAVGIAHLIGMWAVDMLFNAGVVQAYVLALGALAAFLGARPADAARQAGAALAARPGVSQAGGPSARRSGVR